MKESIRIRKMNVLLEKSILLLNPQLRSLYKEKESLYLASGMALSRTTLLTQKVASLQGTALQRAGILSQPRANTEPFVKK